MGLFTNRKRNEDDVEGLSEAASLLAQFSSSPDNAPVDAGDTAPTDTAPTGTAPTKTAVIETAVTETSVFAQPETAAPPRRRLEDRPRAQAGNVKIDAEGLLSMLGVDDTATLIDISEAQQRFLGDHQPNDSDDADAAEIKEAIRREVNTAYASFRLTYAA